MLHSFSSRYFLVVGIHCFYDTLCTYFKQWCVIEMKKYKFFLCNNILNVVQVLKKKHEQKKYANIITSWIESSVEKRFIDDDNDELCCFLCVYASVTYFLYCCSFIQNWTMFLGVVSLVIKDCCCCHLSVKAHSIHYQYL